MSRDIAQELEQLIAEEQKIRYVGHLDEVVIPQREWAFDLNTAPYRDRMSPEGSKE